MIKSNPILRFGLLVLSGVMFFIISPGALERTVSTEKDQIQRNIKPSLNSLSDFGFFKNSTGYVKGVKFYKRISGGTVFISPEGEIVYSFPPSAVKTGGKKDFGLVNITEKFIDAKASDVIGRGKSSYRRTYSHNNGDRNNRSDILPYNLVDFGEIYTGINIKLIAYVDTVEKLFCISPGSNPFDIKVKLSGVDEVFINKSGELVAKLKNKTIKFNRPLAFQLIQGVYVPVKVSYKIEKGGYSFEIGDYDTNEVLIIDPELILDF